MSSIAPATKEPFSGYFNLWIDTYDLVNCDEAKGKTLWVKATIGSYASGVHQARYREKTQSFEWKKI